MARSDQEPRVGEATVLQEKLSQVVDGLAAAMARGFVEGLERSGTVKELLALVEELGQRVEELEGEVVARRNQDSPERIEASKPTAEAPAEPPTAPAEASPAVPPEAVPPEAVPPAVAPPVAAAPKPAAAPPPVVNPVPPPPPARPPLGGLSVPLSSRPPRSKARSRTQVRPTVVYRTDPRVQAAAEGKEGSAICLEPGCTRPVHYRGYCLIHYAKVKSTERPSATPMGPSAIPLPPPKRPAASRGKKEGGTKGVFALLYEERGRRILAGFINQMKFDRRDLVQRLNHQFAGMPGVPLEEEDVMVALHYHQLGDALRKREGEILCRHLSKQRGSLTKTAQAMKLDPERLRARIADLHLEDEVARVRNQFREEIMEHHSFGQRLELALTREKYLADLGILAEVDESLRRELRLALGRLPGGADLEARGHAIREELALDEQAYRRMVRRYDLGADLPVPPEAPPKAAEG